MSVRLVCAFVAFKVEFACSSGVVLIDSLDFVSLSRRYLGEFLFVAMKSEAAKTPATRMNARFHPGGLERRTFKLRFLAKVVVVEDVNIVTFRSFAYRKGVLYKGFLAGWKNLA